MPGYKGKSEFCFPQTLNASRSGCVRTIEKILPASETNHIAGFVEFRPLTS